MKHTFFRYFTVFSIFLVTSAYAGMSTWVYDYDHAGLFRTKQVELADLVSHHSFDGKYFKIVLGKQETAITFNDEEYALKAAHLYYHLTKARSYFIKMDGINNDHINQKIIIRLNITNLFDPYGHYSHDDFATAYNTAMTIPKSNDDRIPDVPAWQNEIWFRPPQEILIDTPLLQFAHLFDSRNIKFNLQLLIMQNSITQAITYGWADQLVKGLSKDYSFLILGLGVSAIEVLPKILTYYAKKKKDVFFLETGMIPEIIYHEYAHFALADRMPLTSTPVIEGFANYYAGKVGHKAHWGHLPSKFSRDRGRNAYSDELYTYRTENNMFSTSDFVFKFLWGLQKIFGDEKTDHLLYIMRKDVSSKSNINYHLVNSLFKSLPLIHMNDDNHKMHLHKFMQNLGL